jgi:uncharacterized damage-inducible protein DinB
MSIAQALLAEFEGQVPVTRTFLERLPQDKLTWKPHERSMTAGQLALHIARVPAFVIQSVQVNSRQVPDFSNLMPQPSSVREVLDSYDEGVRLVRAALPQIDDSRMREAFRLVQGDKTVWAIPRGQFLREIMLNHWYQHRGQFSVYLRMLNVPVPATWGPSADELPAFLQKAQSA